MNKNVIKKMSIVVLAVITILCKVIGNLRGGKAARRDSGACV